VKQGWGRRGVTLPFFVGALAYKNNNPEPTVDDARSLLSRIAADPVSGYVTEIGWCPMLQAPVFAARSVASIGFSHGVGITHPTDNQLCLVFSEELQRKGNSSNVESLVRFLVHDAEEPIKNGTYSRNPNSKTYEEFGPGELKFIRDTFEITNRD